MGTTNALHLLPLKLKSSMHFLQLGVFSVGNRLYCVAVAASTGASRRAYCREYLDGDVGGDGGGVVGDGRILPLPLVVELVIFGFRKKNAVV
jgi:hypothetical protein